MTILEYVGVWKCDIPFYRSVFVPLVFALFLFAFIQRSSASTLPNKDNMEVLVAQSLKFLNKRVI